MRLRHPPTIYASPKIVTTAMSALATKSPTLRVAAQRRNVSFESSDSSPVSHGAVTHTDQHDASAVCDPGASELMDNRIENLSEDIFSIKRSFTEIIVDIESLNAHKNPFKLLRLRSILKQLPKLKKLSLVSLLVARPYKNPLIH
jgi:hypothetical protein